MSAANLFDTLGVIPALPGARCRGKHHLFDPRSADEPEREAAEAYALALCHACPAQTRCSEWLESLPPKQRPLGVIAGKVRTPKPVGRPKGKL